MSDERPVPMAEGIPLHGDMPPELFRRYGYEVIDWITGYLADPERHPVLPQLAAGQVAAALPEAAPARGEEFSRILERFESTIVPGITHWNHPGFFAYFAISSTGPAILAEALAAALNVNAMLWRTSPAATELEEVSTEWLRRLLDLPAEFRGFLHDSASTSTLVAIASAREALGLRIRELGLAGREVPRLRIYCSEEAHSSVEKAAITLGIGSAGVRRISTDERFRMRSDALAEAIATDVAAGVNPLCIVATLGTTSTTSIDPLPEIATLAMEHHIWLHIDAAYGGAAAAVPEFRPLLAGWELADSIVVNPHKWLFVPIDCSALFVRRPDLVRNAFTLVPEYLTSPEHGVGADLMEYGPALGRPFRALKLWMTLNYFGSEGIAARIRHHVHLAQLLADTIAREPGWSLEAPTPLSTVVFRFAPEGRGTEEIEEMNLQILRSVNESGEVFLSHTRVHGRLVLRLAIGNIRTEGRHVERAWELLRAGAARCA